MGGDASTPDLSTEAGVLEYLNSITEDPAKTQLEVLTSILRENAQCEYLTRLGLNGRTDLESFRSCVSLSDYDTIKPDLDRIANGENSEETAILCTGRIYELITSSGTSGGQRKYFPKVESERSRAIIFAAIATRVPILSFPEVAKGKALYFLCMRAGETTRSGIVAHPGSASTLKSVFANNGLVSKISTSPWQVFTTPEKDDQMLYCHWLCGLVQFEQVVKLGALFAVGLVRAVMYLLGSWQQICLDIRQGKLHVRIEDTDVREAVEKIIGGPNPELADRIESIFSNRSNWDGIVRELFPNILLVETIATGTMAAYLTILRSYLGDVQIISTVYAASEGSFGINLRPTCAPEAVAYTLLPSFMYFEFLPVSHPHESGADDSASATSKLIDLASVKLGHVYELVVTSSNGLYRYRMEDCLKVKGFYNKAPEFEFVERRNVVLSVDADKTTESDLLGAMNAAGSLMEAQAKTRILDYTTYADVSTTPGHYVFFIELTNQEALQQDVETVLEACCAKIENSLDVIYRRDRNEGRIGPLSLKVVEKGSFDLMREEAVARGAAATQFKTPRCVKVPSYLQLLNARTVKDVSSSELPNYSPIRVGG